MCFIRSITRAAFSAAAVLGLSAPVPAESMAQTIAEVLGTPGVIWTAGDVTAITQPDQAHDGKDCLRINPRGNNPPAGIQTELMALSVVDGYYRSEGLSNSTTFSVAQQKFTASSWKALHILASPGPLVMHNLGTPDRGALYLDEVQIRPAVVVPVAEALDFPTGLVSFPPTPNLRPFAEPDFAPYGADAALLSGPVEFSANLAGPRVLK
ncbi:MAG: hypothetical protein V4675_04235 [Verrucomicrobiota bacterium]